MKNVGGVGCYSWLVARDSWPVKQVVREQNWLKAFVFVLILLFFACFSTVWGDH